MVRTIYSPVGVLFCAAVTVCSSGVALCASPETAPVVGKIAHTPGLAKGLVGLWAGHVPLPGYVDSDAPVERQVTLPNSGTPVMAVFHDTILFREDGTFLVTREETPGTLHYEGRYVAQASSLTLTFGTLGTIRYDLTRQDANWSLRVDDGDPHLLTRVSPDPPTRQGWLAYRGPGGPAFIDLEGTIRQPFLYTEGGVTHDAESYSSWRLVAPPHASARNQPTVELTGMHTKSGVQTLDVPISAIPGLDAQLQRIEASPSVINRQFILELLRVNDTDPAVYVWAVHLQEQSPWVLDTAPEIPPALFPSLDSPTLRDWVGCLPHGSAIQYGPMMRMGMTDPETITDSKDPEYGIKDFSTFCKSKGVAFNLNMLRF